MVEFLLLDRHSPRHSLFAPQIESPDSRLVIGDAFIVEGSISTLAGVRLQLERLSPFADRVYAAIPQSDALRHEVASLVPLTRAQVVATPATAWLRKALNDPHALSQYLTGQEHQRFVKSNRYSDPNIPKNFRDNVRALAGGLHQMSHKGNAFDPIGQGFLESIITGARYHVYKFLREMGHGEELAEQFAKRDSFMFRLHTAALCREVGWAQAHGLEGQKDGDLYREHLDLENVTIGTYCDEFLTNDLRNKRNMANIRSLLAIAPGFLTFAK